MSIVRTPRPQSDFLIISNAVVRDENLSYRARGVLIDLLSRPDNWTTNADAIARRGKEGRDAIRTVLIELETAGYLVRQRIRKPDGTFAHGDDLIYDTPQRDRASGTSSSRSSKKSAGQSHRLETRRRIVRARISRLLKKNRKKKNTHRRGGRLSSGIAGNPASPISSGHKRLAWISPSRSNSSGCTPRRTDGPRRTGTRPSPPG